MADRIERNWAGRAALGALVLATLCATTPAAAAGLDPLPAAAIADAAPDKDYPARLTVAAMPSHGVKIPALVYLASGPGPHPTVILFHGMPGAENNLDIGQAIRRAGWNVVIFHYRGSWGSPGTWSISHCLEDGEAAVAWLRDPKTAKALNSDPNRIAVMGHSLGGFVAGYTGAHDPKLLGVASFSSGNFGAQSASAPRGDVIAFVKRNAQTDDGLNMLGDASPESIADDLIANGKAWDLGNFGPGLAAHPLLIITADDGLQEVDEAIGAAAEKAKPGAPVTRIHFATNHAYNDHRVALAGALIRWLQSLPGAPQ